jgi:hypothetical protein
MRAYLLVALAAMVHGDQRNPSNHTYTTSDNAALQYSQAFGFLALHCSDLSDQEKQALENWKDTSLTALTSDLVKKCGGARAYLNRGSLLRNCNWGLQLREDGIAAPLVHVHLSWRIHKWIGLYCRQMLAAGKTKEAIDAFIDLLTLARQLESGDSTALGLLVGIGIEGDLMQCLASQIPPDAKRDELRDLLARFDALPSPGPLSRVVRMEKELYLGPIRAQGIAWTELIIPDLQHDPGAVRREVIRTFLGIRECNKEALCKAIDELFDRSAGFAALPPDDCEVAAKAHSKKLEDEFGKTLPLIANVFPRLIMPPVANLRFGEARTIAHRSMFRAGLVMLIDGKDRLGATVDPFGKGPFGYRAVDRGFELTSKLTISSKDRTPVALSFGTGQKSKQSP